MKKLTKSAKIILISVISLICVAAIVLGCIFGIKKKPEDIDDNPSGPVNTVLTRLAADINAAHVEPTFSVLNEVPYTGVKGCTYQNIKKFGDNYFSFEDENGNEQFYTFKKNASGAYEYKCLTNKTNDSVPGFVHEDASAFEIGDCNGDYIVIISYIGEEKKESIIRSESLVYIENNNEIEIFNINNLDSEFVDYDNFSGKSLNKSIALLDEFFAFTYYETIFADGEAKSIKPYVYGSKYVTTNRINEDDCKILYQGVGDYSLIEIDYYDTSLIIRNEAEIEYVGLKDGEFNLKILDLKTNENELMGFDIYKISNYKFFIQKYLKVEDDIPSKNSYYSKNYDNLVSVESIVVDFSMDVLSENEFELKDEYGCFAKVSNVSSDSEYFYVCQQKVSENNLIQKFSIGYYDQDGILLFEYESDELEEILVAKNNNFLTKNKIIEPNLSTKSVIVKNSLGGSGLDFVSPNGNASQIVYQLNGLYQIMDPNGNLLKNNDNSIISFPYIYPINEGYAIAYNFTNNDIKEYYLINTITGNCSFINNFYDDDNFSVILNKGYGLYLTSNSEGIYSLYKNNSLLLENINSFKFSQVLEEKTGIEFNIQQKEESVLLVLKDNLNYTFDNSIYDQKESNDESLNNENTITAYDAAYKWTGDLNIEKDGIVYGKIHVSINWTALTHWDYVSIEMNPYYYLESIDFDVRFYDWNNFTIANGRMESDTKTPSGDMNRPKEHDSNQKISLDNNIVSYSYGERKSVYYTGTDTGRVSINSFTVRGFPYKLTFDIENFDTKSDGTYTNNQDSEYMHQVAWSEDNDEDGTPNGNYSEYEFFGAFNNANYRKSMIIGIEYGKQISVYKELGQYNYDDRDKYAYYASMTGFKFLGWFNSKDFWTIDTTGYEENLSNEVTSFLCTGNKILYPNWLSNQYNVVYNFDGGSGGNSNFPTLVNYDESVLIHHPEKDGYTFIGWEFSDLSNYDSNHQLYVKHHVSIDGESISFTGTEKTILNDGLPTSFNNLHHIDGATVTLKALWRPNNYKVEFVFAEGNKIPFLDSNSSTGLTAIGYDSNGLIGYLGNSSNRTSLHDNRVSYIFDGNVFRYSTKYIYDIFDPWNIGSDFVARMLSFEEVAGSRINKWVYTDPGDYQISGWAYKDSSGIFHKVENKSEFYRLKDCWGANGSMVTLNEGEAFRLYAYYTERDYYVDTRWEACYGSSKFDSFSDINREMAFYPDKFSVTVGNTDNGNATFFNTKTYAYSQSYDKNLTPYRGSMFNVKRANNLKVSISNPSPEYLVDSIVLEHFPYKDSSGNYRLGTFTIKITWSEYGGTASSDDLHKVNNNTFYADAANNGINIIKIGNLTYDEVEISVMNVDYASFLNSTNGYVSDAVLSSASVGSTGIYGFVVRPVLRSNYENIDNVITNGDYSESSSLKITDFNNNMFSQYFAVYTNNNSNEAWINGKPVDFGNNSPYIFNNTAYYGNKNSVNYANTQIIAISPRQAFVKTSDKVGSEFVNGAHYELINYLTYIRIGSKDYDITGINRVYGNNNRYTFGDMFNGYNDAQTYRKYDNIGNKTGEIWYFGETYLKIAYLTIDDSEIGSYTLYVGQNSTNGHIMYFLISDSRLKGNDIEFGFEEIENSINIAQTTPGTYSGENEVVIDSKYSSDGSTWNNFTYSLDEGSATPEFITNLRFNPTNAYYLAFTPRPGYLIDRITVTLGSDSTDPGDSSGSSADIIGYQFELNRDDIQLYRYSNVTSYYNQKAGGGYEFGFKYRGTQKHLLQKEGDNYFGLSYSNYLGASWDGANAVDPSFETFYLLISGIYDIVNIQISSVSYFEVDIKDSDNLLGLNDKALRESDLNLLGFADSYIGRVYGTVIKPNPTHIYENYYRLIFIGRASSFRDGFALLATDNNYSYYFDSAIFYGVDTESNLSEIQGVNAITKAGKTNKYLYLEAKLSDLFADTGYSGNDFIRANKYQLYLEVKKNDVTLSSNAYLSNNNISESGNQTQDSRVSSVKLLNGTFDTSSILPQIYGNIAVIGDKKYQLDNPNTKVQSWFNDVTLNNINYTFNRNKTEINSNWQSQTSGVSMAVNGYGIKIKYYEIPGYYLEYIDFNFLDTDSDGGTVSKWVYFDTASGVNNSGTIEGTNITYSLVYNTTENYIELMLYKDVADTSADGYFEQDNLSQIVDCLGILAGDINVNFYSSAREINVALNDNVGESVSSKATLDFSQNSVKVVYDSLQSLAAFPTMKGYTFVGWGSENYFDGENNSISRFSAGNGENLANVWNSSSSWVNISNYFRASNRTELASLALDNLLFSSDFYVGGGNFITDTGFNGGTGRDVQTQSYNFWSAYADIFMQSLGKNENSDFEYNIDLYAIWKANTYNVILNLNDADMLKAGSDTLKNGSTSSFFKHKDFTFNTNTTFNGLVDIGNLRYPVGENGNSPHYLFVTYDTNDWYILVEPINPYADPNASKYAAQSLKDYVIDRYGYTWLGWFAEQLENYRQTENNLNSSVLSVMTTEKYAAGSSSNEFPVFAYDNFSKFKVVNDEVVDSFVVNNSSSIYNGKTVSTFIYKNEFGTYNRELNHYIFFYDYTKFNKDAGDVLANTKYYSEDLLNDYQERYDYYEYFTYFDTAINYLSNDGKFFNSVTDMFNSGKLKRRSVTIFAYWQTNLYDVLIDYTDAGSNKASKTGVGSSSVVLNNKYVFEPIYFDDDVSSRLNKFIPIRLGYDFIGWSFNPQIAESGVLKTYEFARAGSYILDGNIFNFLFKDNLFREQLTTDNREALGDSESEHYIYMFAGWTPQTYSINISLNILKEGLENLYRADSEFTLALYGSADEYFGINQNFLMENSDKFNDIVANVSFDIVFDSLLSEAKFVINSSSGASTAYSLDKLFATSAGYYLLGFIYDQNDTASYVIRNTLSSYFDESGKLKNFAEGESAFAGDMLETRFDENFFNLVYTSTYLDGNGERQKLSDIDFESIMNLGVTRTADGKEYFDTFEYSTNKSTNFGYITINGKDYYLATLQDGVSYVMYYLDEQGEIQYVQPFFELDGQTFVANNLNNTFRFDESNFYYLNYIIYFESGEGFNAYFAQNGYDSRTKINIKFALKDAINDFEIDGKEMLDYTAIKTRLFTLYAHYENKTNFSIYASNINNVGETGESNAGLAGYYQIENSNIDGLSVSGSAEIHNVPYRSVSTDNFGDTKIGLDSFNYYDDIKLDILPYYNGRYLTEMTFKFYSVEHTPSEGNPVLGTYQRVTYVIHLKFTWDNKARTPIISSEGSYVSRNGMPIAGVTFAQSTQGILTISDFKKISNVDNNAFDENSKNAGFMKIGSYASYEPLNRLDVNHINISMQNAKSDVEVACKFSVQTFDVEFYNVYDDSGFSLASTGMVDTGEYTVGSHSSLRSLLTKVDSARFSDGASSYGVTLALGDVINLYETDKLATISTDCANKTESYNVPYGFFIYGNYQMDSPVSDEIGLGREEFGGYDYIYEYGYYNFGTTGRPLNNSSYQSSPVLGAPGLFGESVRRNSTLYTFYSWFEASEKAGTLVLNDYDIDDEKTYISRNIVLIGYYYANNKPTNIQFYTWNDKTHSYTEYTENIDQYTLQSTDATSSFEKSSSTLIEASIDSNEYVDEKGRAIIKLNKSYGVDAVGFSGDNFNSSFIKNDELGLNSDFVNGELIRTYWYYRYQNYFLYIEGESNKYVRFDTAARRFYYLEDESDSESTKHYINLYSTDIKDPSFTVYADLDPENSGVVINNESDLENYISTTNSLVRLSVDDSEYIYNLIGSKMYAKQGERYYEIKKIEGFASDDALSDDEKALVSKLVPNATGSNVSAKYYVKLADTIYYLIVSNGSSGQAVSDASLLYEYSESVLGLGSFNSSSINESVSVVNIDNYFMMIGEEFFEVKYGSEIDEFGNKYINPYSLSNTLEVNSKQGGVDTNLRLYFNYNDKQFYLDSALTESLTDEISEYKVYTPVNDNYSVSILYLDGVSKWEYDSVKIKTLPSPNIGFWYDNNSYSYIGYIKMLESDIDYLVDKSIYSLDESGNPTYPNSDPNKVQYKDRIYDTLYKYINTMYSGLGSEQKNLLYQQALDYVNAYKTGKYYLSSIITVQKDGYIYKPGTNVIEYIDALISLKVPITIDGEQSYINTTVNYRFNMIDSDTVINENIHAIPIYSPNIIEYTASSIKTSGTTASVDISKMNVQYFETTENLYTHMYGVKYGDYLNFAILNETQFNSMMRSINYPSELAILLSDSRYGIWSESNPNGIKVLSEQSFVSETDGELTYTQMDIDFSGLSDGKYYIVSYYNKAGQNYPVRVADNTICITVSGGTISHSIVSTKVIP